VVANICAIIWLRNFIYAIVTLDMKIKMDSMGKSASTAIDDWIELGYRG
jgi:hypothetical protein